MYFDNKPCASCGSEVRLRARSTPVEARDQPQVGSHGAVGDADSTVDERRCTNPLCPTNQTDAPSDAPLP
jgi:hypothetical protein